MKEIAGYLIVAVVLAVLGIVCLGVSRMDREMADAQQAFVTADYAAAKAALTEVERYYQYVSGVPWIGAAPANDVRTRRATLAYWERQYGALAPPDRTDPVADVPADNVSLQLIVANA